VLVILRGKQSNNQPKRRDEVNPASGTVTGHPKRRDEVNPAAGIVTGEDARRWIKFDLN
jgi:hypothetical protein